MVLWRLYRRWCWQRMGTLKFRVMLVAVMSALLSAAASSYFMASKNERIMLSGMEMQQQDEVELAAAMLGSRVSRVQAHLRLLASEVSPPLLARPAALERQLYSHPLALEMFSAVLVVRPDGNVQATAAHNLQQLPVLDFSRQVFFQRTVATGAIGVSDPMPSRLSDEPIVLMSVPVHDLSGRVVAVVAGALPLQSADMLPSASSTLGQFSAALVVYSSNGAILSHPDAQRRLGRVADEPGLGALVAARQEGTPALASHALSRYLVSIAQVPSTDWHVARVTGTDYALQPLRQVLTESWAVVACIMAVCAALSTLLIAGITRPITQLRDRAQQLLGAERDPSAGWPRASGEIGQLVQVFRHVTQERNRAQESQSAMVEQLKAILKNASVGIAITRDRHFEVVSSQACRLFGYADDELLGRNAAVLYPTAQAYQEAGKKFRTALKTQSYFDGEVQVQRKDGRMILVHMRGRNVIDGRPASGVIWIFTDVTIARAQQDQLSWTATHDSLTQLVNRLDFEARLSAAITQAGDPLVRSEICAMFIDLDHFKPINDTAGHAAGDEVLRQIARLLVAHVRQSDIVARLGGDEFAILLPGCSLTRALRIAEQVRAGVAAWSMRWRTHTFGLGASIGVVQLRPDLADVAAVLEAADSACYEAKRRGRNQVVAHGFALDSV